MLGSQVPMELVTSVADMVTLGKPVQRKANKDLHKKRLFNVTIVGNAAIHKIGVFSFSENCASKCMKTASRRSKLEKVINNREDQET
jgi:hypothetical protein